MDFVLAAGKAAVAIEVKGGRRRTLFPGMGSFTRVFPVQRQPLVYAQGVSLEEFLTTPVEHGIITA